MAYFTIFLPPSGPSLHRAEGRGNTVQLATVTPAGTVPIEKEYVNSDREYSPSFAVAPILGCVATATLAL